MTESKQSYYETSSRDLTARLNFFPQLREAARAITLALFQNPVPAENKSQHDYDPVTEADIEAERVLRRLIGEKFPDDSIIGEELEDITGTNSFTWTLDPIDGTRGFIAGVPVWSTLIALSDKDQPVLGMIDLPALSKTYMGAVDNNGTPQAWLEEAGLYNQIKTAPCAQLKDAVIGCTEPLAMFNAGELAAYNIIRTGTRFSRLGLDALGYGLVAQGRMNIIIEADLKPCDVRALIPIIVGAGGAMTNWHGGSCVDGGQVVAVSDAALLPELYTYLGRAMTPA